VANDPEVVKKKFVELGSTGLNRWAGQVEEEFLPQLKGRRAVQVYREMRDNDPVVGAVVFAVDMLLRQISWRTEPASQDWEDLKAEQLLKDCMEDMSHTWEDLVSEILSMLTFGWSWHEVVYKRRLGDVRNPQFRSKFNDGLIGWRKMPIRSQDTLVDWIFDDDGGVQALKQQAPPDMETHVIPISKSLLFRTNIHKNNPEGRSILRNAYRPWYFKKRMEEVEGIGIERDLAGLPVAWVPAEMLSPLADEADQQVVAMFKKMVRNVRRDEQEGLVLPLEYDPETKQPLYKFELLNSGGTRAINIDGAITRYEQRIAMTILADFILLGHEQTGSYALSVNKTGIFRTALNSWAQAIAEVFNRHEIPRLFALNGWTHLKDFPKIVPGEVDPPDLSELGQFITQVSGSGMTLFPDPDLEDFIRQVAKLPEKSEDAQFLQDQQQMLDQQQAMLGGENDQAEDYGAEEEGFAEFFPDDEEMFQ
jgi:hypothetical protein